MVGVKWGDRPVPFFSQATTFEELWPLISRDVGEVISHGNYSHGHTVAELAQAAVAKLTRLDADIARRVQLAAACTERLRDIPEIIRLPTLARRPGTTTTAYYCYVIEVQRREELLAYLARNGVQTDLLPGTTASAALLRLSRPHLRRFSLRQGCV